MAAKKKEDGETQEKKSSNSILKGILNDNKKSHYNFDNPLNSIISTGSMILDSYVKIRAGSTVRLCGEGAELGKTSQCFVLAGEYMKTIPNSKTIFFAAESRLSPEMMDRSGHTFVKNEDDWDFGTVFIMRSNAFGFVADTIEKLMKPMKDMGEHLCVIIDSLDGLILEDDLERKSVTESTTVAGVPKLTKLLFRRIGLLNWASDGLILVTSQYSSNIKIDPYTKDIPRQASASGGNNAGHQSDYTFMYLTRYPSKDYILEDPKIPMDKVKNKLLGLYATIEIKKSATDETGAKLRIPIKKGRIGNQVWVEKEVADLIMAYELVDKAGSWLSFDSSIIADAAKDGVTLIEKVQGSNKLYNYLEENKDVLEWFKAKLIPSVP